MRDGASACRSTTRAASLKARRSCASVTSISARADAGSRPATIMRPTASSIMVPAKLSRCWMSSSASSRSLIATGVAHRSQRKSKRSFCSSGQKVTYQYRERRGETLDDVDSRVSSPPLDAADIGPVDSCPVGIILLAPATCLPQQANVSAEAFAYVHAHPERAMYSIDLQPMSNNVVDLSLASTLSLVSDE